MKYNLVVTHQAQNDILQAADWYEEQKRGLGELYMLSIDKCIKLILKNPFAFAVIYLQIRKATKKKYPYSLYYRINETAKQVTIFAVIHHHRSEETWKERIDKELP